jgi:hypothetical protein
MRDLPEEKRGGAGSSDRRNLLVPAQNETVNNPEVRIDSVDTVAPSAVDDPVV